MIKGIFDLKIVSSYLNLHKICKESNISYDIIREKIIEDIELTQEECLNISETLADNGISFSFNMYRDRKLKKEFNF